MSDKEKDFQALFHKSNKQLGNPKSIFGDKGKKEEIKSVWIDKKWYIKLKLLTLKYDHTNVKYWANKAIKYAYEHGELK